MTDKTGAYQVIADTPYRESPYGVVTTKVAAVIIARLRKYGFAIVRVEGMPAAAKRDRR